MTKPTIPESRRARSRTLREMRGMRGKVFSSQFSAGRCRAGGFLKTEN
jgi:hypothetical protein